MKKSLAQTAGLLILLFYGPTASAQIPDGTVVYSSKPGAVIGRVAQRWATRAQGYHARDTHVGIVLGGRVYHADYPHVTSYPIGQHKSGEVVRYETPTRRYTIEQIGAMKDYANSQIGQPYRLRGFLETMAVRGGVLSSLDASKSMPAII